MDPVTTLLEYVKSHVEDDRSNFTAIREQLVLLNGSLSKRLDKIDDNVTSLKETRSYNRGVSTAALWIAGTIATLAGTALSTAIAWALRASH
jgi:hypothetical protein